MNKEQAKKLKKNDKVINKHGKILYVHSVTKAWNGFVTLEELKTRKCDFYMINTSKEKNETDILKTNSYKHKELKMVKE